MIARVLPRPVGYEDHILDYATKMVARDLEHWPGGTKRHAYLGQTEPDQISGVAEAWRFPVIEPHFEAGLTPEERERWNEVTFVYAAPLPVLTPPVVTVLGLPFAALREVVLTPVGDSRFLAATVLLPAGRVYRYGFRVDGAVGPDPVNPQRTLAANGERLSVFFTDYCTMPVTFEPWERVLLRRLVERILPLQSSEQEQFERQPGGNAAGFVRLQTQIHVLDQSVGAVNYLDKVLAREERHRLRDYRVCLAQIDRVLRQRNPYGEPGDATRAAYESLYGEMASGNVPGWDYHAYGSPSFFLQLLRRHVWTGTFCHPRYGGNGNADGWRWLAERYPFAWDAGLEPALGSNPEYRG